MKYNKLLYYVYVFIYNLQPSISQFRICNLDNPMFKYMHFEVNYYIFYFKKSRIEDDRKIS